MTTNINDSIFDEDLSGSTDDNQGHNEAKVIKTMLMSIISSKEIQKEEAQNIKELKEDLKNNHGMSGKTTDMVVKILMKPEAMNDYDNDYAEVLKIVSKLKVLK